jgi:hypothetical protein
MGTGRRLLRPRIPRAAVRAQITSVCCRPLVDEIGLPLCTVSDDARPGTHVLRVAPEFLPHLFETALQLRQRTRRVKRLSLGLRLLAGPLVALRVKRQRIVALIRLAPTWLLLTPPGTAFHLTGFPCAVVRDRNRPYEFQLSARSLLAPFGEGRR